MLCGCRIQHRCSFPIVTGTVIVQPSQHTQHNRHNTHNTTVTTHTAQPTFIPQRNMILQKWFWFGPTLQTTRIPGEDGKYFTEQ
jgi:hypothetical protein